MCYINPLPSRDRWRRVYIRPDIDILRFVFTRTPAYLSCPFSLLPRAVSLLIDTRIARTNIRYDALLRWEGGFCKAPRKVYSPGISASRSRLPGRLALKGLTRGGSFVITTRTGKYNISRPISNRGCSRGRTRSAARYFSRNMR